MRSRVTRVSCDGVHTMTFRQDLLHSVPCGRGRNDVAVDPYVCFGVWNAWKDATGGRE